jgi:hypothetical protein
MHADALRLSKTPLIDLQAGLPKRLCGFAFSPTQVLARFMQETDRSVSSL